MTKNNKKISVSEKYFKIYFIIIITFSLLGTIFYLPKNYLMSLETAVETIWVLIIYIGLRTKQSWLPPLVLLYASIDLLFRLIIPANSLLTFLIKFFIIGTDIYLIYYFSRKKTRQEFKTKGVFFFS